MGRGEAVAKRRTKPLKSLDEILVELRALKPILREKYGVQEMWVFGSYVHGTAKKKSDLDVLVVFDDRPISFFDFTDIELYLGDSIGIRVDLVEKQTLKPYIGQTILATCLPI